MNVYLSGETHPERPPPVARKCHLENDRELGRPLPIRQASVSMRRPIRHAGFQLDVEIDFWRSPFAEKGIMWATQRCGLGG